MLAALRGATAAAHERLEQRLALTEVGASRDRYRRVLIGMYGYLEPLERLLVAASPLRGLDLLARRRVPALLRDLGSLDVRAAELVAAPKEVWPSRPRAEELAGWLYVSEGSRLGGAVLARRLAAPLRLSMDEGLAFFAGDGADRTTRLWHELLAAFAGWPNPESAAPVVAAAGLDAFERLERALERAGGFIDPR